VRIAKLLSFDYQTPDESAGKVLLHVVILIFLDFSQNHSQATFEITAFLIFA